MTLQMWSEYDNHETKAGLGAPEGFVSRFVTLFTMQTMLDTENYVTNVVRVRKSQYKAGSGPREGFVNRFVTLFSGKIAQSAQIPA